MNAIDRAEVRHPWDSRPANQTMLRLAEGVVDIHYAQEWGWEAG